MMEVARWTPSPTVEAQDRSVSEGVGRAEWGVRLAMLAGIAGCPLSCFSFLSAGVWWAVGIAYVVVAVKLIARAYDRRDDARQAVWQAKADAIEEFGWGDGWLVDLIVHQGDAPTGSDRGMLWIEDGRLLFAGRRTSFGLGGGAVDGRCRLTPGVAGLRHELSLDLRARTAAGPLGISFVPLARAKWQDRATAQDVREAVDRWVARSSPEAGQLPPIDPGPGTASARRLLARAFGAAGFWAAWVGVTAGVALKANVFVAVLAAMIGLLSGVAQPAVWAVGTRFRAWRDMRSVERRVRSGELQANATLPAREVL